MASKRTSSWKKDFKWYLLSSVIGAGTIALLVTGCDRDNEQNSGDQDIVSQNQELVVVIDGDDIVRGGDDSKWRDSMMYYKGRLDERERREDDRGSCKPDTVYVPVPAPAPAPKPQPKPQQKSQQKPAQVVVEVPVVVEKVVEPQQPAVVNQVVVDRGGNSASAVVTGDGSSVIVVNEAQKQAQSACGYVRVQRRVQRVR